MLIGMNELELVERDAESGVETRVLYYTVAGEDFPALVRRVTLTNVGEGSVDVEAADGLAKLEAIKAKVDPQGLFQCQKCVGFKGPVRDQ